MEQIKPMTADRIKEIHQATAYPESTSVYKALLQVWNECAHYNNSHTATLQAEIDRLKKENEELKSRLDSIKEFSNNSMKMIEGLRVWIETKTKKI